jgi:hypothetical protein
MQQKVSNSFVNVTFLSSVTAEVTWPAPASHSIGASWEFRKHTNPTAESSTHVSINAVFS